jgi:hypothetical protein
MKLSELISGPGFYGEIIIMEPDGMNGDDLSTDYKEAYHRMDFRPLNAVEIPPRLLSYIVKEVSARDGESMSNAIFLYCTPH